MGIDWWEGDPFLSSRGRDHDGLEGRLRRLEEAAGLPLDDGGNKR
jgi:hypothetical protein